MRTLLLPFRRILAGAGPGGFLVLVLALAGVAAAVDAGDGAAMAALAASLSGLPAGGGWDGKSDACQWQGVRCSPSGRVTDINLARRGISGSLPASVAKLSALNSLQLQGNSISGPLPSFAGLAALTRLMLDGNQFSSIPDGFFSGLAALKFASLNDIPFAPWSNLDSITDAATLDTFSAANCSFSGEFPAALAGMQSLTAVRLSYNSLTGVLPATLAGSSIQTLQLNNQKSSNKLSGPINVIAAMPSLVLVWLQSNSFSGPIPDLSNLTGLQSFNVRDNGLTGVVPASLQGLTMLKNVSLSNNMLQGPMPAFGGDVTADISSGNNYCLKTAGPCDPRVNALLAVASGFGYPLVLAEAWSGNDPCAGWAGVSCDAAGKEVTTINLANRNLSGTISPAIANLTSVTRVILSNNQIRGLIPVSMTMMPQLQLLDVTDNDLTGDIPSFASTVTLKLAGNKFGQPDNSGDGSLSGGNYGSSGGAGRSSNSKSSTVGVAVGVVVAILVLLICVWILFVIYKKKRSEKIALVRTKSSPGVQEMVNIGVQGENGYVHSETELNVNVNNNRGGGNSSNPANNVFEMQGLHMSVESLRAATDNFSERKILGRGGFGVVYLGTINGAKVAVKRSQSDAMGKKGLEEFRAEIDVLRKVRHRHLVALLGYCDDGKERLLVYEYMSRGTLGEHLHARHESGFAPLTWTQRLVIALDVARGIEYLHSLAQESFIHRDLKPSNILLDKDLRAKVSDFGLVKLASNPGQSMMTRLAGTFGYLAPEYAITGKVSTKIDVFAFGVILMELITGRKSLDDSLPDDESNLVVCFRRYMLDREKFMMYVDPTMELDDEARGKLMEVAELARHCAAREPSQRPDMSHCVNRLSSLVDQWKPAEYDAEVEEEEQRPQMGLNQRLAKWRTNDNSSMITESFMTSTYTESPRRV